MAQDSRIFSDPFAPTGGLRPFEATPRPAPRSSSVFSSPAPPAPVAPQTPDTAARVLTLQAKTGLPAPVIERNLDEIERDVTSPAFDTETFRAQSPYLSQWLAENPAHQRAAALLGELQPVGQR